MSFIVASAFLFGHYNVGFQRTPDGIRVQLADQTLALKVRDPHSIRVMVSPSQGFFDRETFVELPVAGRTPFTLSSSAAEVTLTTSAMKARVQLTSGKVSFFDLKGKLITQEADRTLQPSPQTLDHQGLDQTFQVRQQWEPNADESLYGLGQHPWGPLDLKGLDFDLWQRNSAVVVPFLVSSRGYGIYWENSSFSRFGNLEKPANIDPADLRDFGGKSGGLTATFYGDRDFSKLVATKTVGSIDYPNPVSGEDGLGFPGLSPQTAPRVRGNSGLDPGLPRGDVSVRWEGSIDPPKTGDYLFDTYSNGGIRVFADGQLLIDHWRQSWLPEKDIVKVPMVKGKLKKIRIEWVKDQGADTFVFRWKPPQDKPRTSLWSEVGQGIDYTFVYGPSLDRVVAGYRDITGKATMPPIWAMGLWQSRQRYENQAQSLDVVRNFRRLQIPFDNIVQDWFYWKKDQWGSHQFDPERFPDPVGWINSLHGLHSNLMISVWGKFYPGTSNFDEMKSNGFLFQPNLDEGRKDWVGYPFTFFDAFNPKARDLFWNQISKALLTKGVDAWWMDASEPDLMSIPNLEGHRARMVPTAAGSPSPVINDYGIRTAQAVYEGQRRDKPEARVFNLTRSGFAGQQRYGATTWSGDITSTWTALKRQIPDGLGFSISGNPYWTMDTGGFSVPARFASRNPKPADLDEWRELNTRWFEFGTFVPILRTHGEFPYREMWQFGGEGSPAYNAMLKFDRLRYRLLPYIYSLAGACTQGGATIMRPLVMDYPDDVKARTLTDEYLFGPSLLICPIVRYQQRTREVLLPKGTWFDFWTGQLLQGGQSIRASAPYDQIPIFVKAGSILASGPELQYTTEKKVDPMLLTVYEGVNAHFSLYEDDGLSNAYERGGFSTVPIDWSEKGKTLTIGKRAGDFSGMLQTRTFKVQVVSTLAPLGFNPDSTSIKTIAYKGDLVSIKL